MKNFEPILKAKDFDNMAYDLAGLNKDLAQEVLDEWKEIRRLKNE